MSFFLNPQIGGKKFADVGERGWKEKAQLLSVLQMYLKVTASEGNTNQADPGKGYGLFTSLWKSEWRGSTRTIETSEKQEKLGYMDIRHYCESCSAAIRFVLYKDMSFTGSSMLGIKPYCIDFI